MRRAFFALLLIFLALLPRAFAQSASASPHEFPVAPVQNGTQQVALGHSVVALMGPWKFRLGDSPQANGADAPLWAQPGFDDSSWQDYTLKKQGWPESFLTPPRALDSGWKRHGHPRETGDGWYRIRVHLSGATGPVHLLLPYINDAATVYWDGRKVGGYGDPARHLAYPNARTQSLPIPAVLSPSGEHVIAVWVWSAPTSQYESLVQGGGILGAPILAQSLSGQAIQTLRDRTDQFGAFATAMLSLLFFLVGVVSLVLFFYNRNRREYLWVGLTLILSMLQSMLQAIDLFSRAGWMAITVYSIVGAVCAVFLLALLLALQWLLELQDQRAMTRANVAVGLLACIYPWRTTVALYQGWTAPRNILAILQFIRWFPLVLCLCCFVWMAVVGVRKLKRQAWLMLSPGAVVVLLFLWFFVAARYLPAVVDAAGAYTLLGLVPVSVLVILLYRFVRQWREHQRLENDFEQARQVQQLLVPSATPSVLGFSVESVYLPASEVGGDFFHVQPADDGSLLIVVGDVSGKGLKAAMTVSTIIGALRNEPSRQPAEILDHLNRVLHGQIKGFATCCTVLITADGAMTIANAGHIPPYRDGEEIAVENGLPLGVIAECAYSETKIRLAPGNRLTFVSDGVVEAANAKRELFGFDRMHGISSQSAANIANAAQQFGQEDDITVVSVAYSGAAALGEATHAT